MERQPQSDRAIFQSALDIDSTQARLKFIADVCSHDGAQFSRVKALLESLEADSSFMDQPLPDLMYSSLECPEEELLGSEIGPYKLREQIGQGGMGVVYIAEQMSPVRRMVALKVVKPGNDTKDVIARFEAERQALALMDHPNISKVLEAGCTDSGRPFFVMELVRGLPITKYCDEYELDTHQRLQIFSDVCHAVQHAHQKGIIHRDIKPSNILVTRNGEQAIPKVIDFGVAKAIDQRLTDETIYTRRSQLIGTPLYMSPEQAELSELDVDTRSDVYSLGVVLYELLTGSTPFHKDDLHSVGFDEMRRIIREVDPPRPSDRISTLSDKALSTVCGQRRCDIRQIKNRLKGELDWIVMKALEKDRNRRYDSPKAFASDVRRYLDNETVEASPPSNSYRLKKLLSKHRLAISSIALVALALIAGVIGTGWQAIKATHERDQKRMALNDLTIALVEKEEALAVASSNLGEAIVEKQRASENLKLAMRTVDEVYLKAIGADSPYQRQFDWTLMPGDETALLSRMSTGPDASFTNAEISMLKKGLELYEKLSQQNPSSNAAKFESATALVRVAQIQTSMGQTSEAEHACRNAIDILRKLISSVSDNSRFHLALGRANYHLGQITRWSTDASVNFENAVTAATQCVQLSNDCLDGYRLRAKANIALSRYELAESDLRYVVNVEPERAIFHSDLGRLYFHMNDFRKSLVHCRIAVELEPSQIERTGFRHYLALVYRNRNVPNREDAAKVWETALPYAKQASDEFRLRVKAAEARLDFQTMVDLTNEWEKTCGESCEVLLHRSTGNGGVGNLQLALDDLNRVVELAVQDRSKAWALADAGANYHFFGDNELAAKAFRKAIQINRNNHVSYYSLGFVLDQQKKHREAIKVCTEGLSVAPRYAPLYQVRAYSSFKIGNYSQTIADLGDAIECDPTNKCSFVVMMQDEVRYCSHPTIRKGLKRLLTSVLADCTRIIELDPGNAESWNARVEVNVTLGRFDDAIRDATQAIKLAAGNPSYWESRGFAYSENGQWPAAIKDFTKAKDLDPTDPFRWTTLANGQLESWNIEGAIESYSQAVTMLPGEAALFSDRGFAYMESGEIEKAISDFTEAIRLESAVSSDYLFRADAFVEANRYEEALADYTKAIELNPKSPEGVFSRSSVFMQTGDYDKALKDASRCVALEPGQPLFRLWRALVYLRILQIDKAARDSLTGLGLFVLPRSTKFMLASPGSSMALNDSLGWVMPGLRRFLVPIRWLEYD